MAEVDQRACRDAQDHKSKPREGKMLELKFADDSVDQVEAMKRRLVFPLASLDSSGSNRSLSLGKVFSGEQVGLESVGRRHSGLLEDTKDWPERTRQMQ